jgi:hypothetical protein
MVSNCHFPPREDAGRVEMLVSLEITCPHSENLSLEIFISISKHFVAIHPARVKYCDCQMGLNFNNTVQKEVT